MALKNLNELKSDRPIKKSEQLPENLFTEPTKMDLYNNIIVSSHDPRKDYRGKGLTKEVVDNFERFLELVFDERLQIDLIYDFERSFDDILDNLDINTERLKIDPEYLQEFYKEILNEFAEENGGPNFDYLLGFYLSTFLNTHMEYVYVEKNGGIDAIYYPSKLYDENSLENIVNTYYAELKRLEEAL